MKVWPNERISVCLIDYRISRRAFLLWRRVQPCCVFRVSVV